MDFVGPDNLSWFLLLKLNLVNQPKVGWVKVWRKASCWAEGQVWMEVHSSALRLPVLHLQQGSISCALEWRVEMMPGEAKQDMETVTSSHEGEKQQEWCEWQDLTFLDNSKSFTMLTTFRKANTSACSDFYETKEKIKLIFKRKMFLVNDLLLPFTMWQQTLNLWKLARRYISLTNLLELSDLDIIYEMSMCVLGDVSTLCNDTF